MVFAPGRRGQQAPGVAGRGGLPDQRLEQGRQRWPIVGEEPDSPQRS